MYGHYQEPPPPEKLLYYCVDKKRTHVIPYQKQVLGENTEHLLLVFRLFNAIDFGTDNVDSRK